MSDIKEYCENCRQKTNQIIMKEIKENLEFDLDFYQIICCQGCETKSFRHVYEERQSIEETASGELAFPVKIKNHPQFIVGHQVIKELHYLPELVKTMY